MIREFLKWDYELRNFVQLEAVVDRALSVATADPQGIAYLTLPREVLAESQTEFRFNAAAPISPRERLRPDPAVLKQAAVLLATAESPLLITTSLGRDPDAVGGLGWVVGGPGHPGRGIQPHPRELPYEVIPITSVSTRPLSLSDATSSSSSRAMLPWFPSWMPVNPRARVIHLGTDPLFVRYPIRTFPTNVTTTA